MPLPVPALVTVSVEVVGVGGAAANVAVTLRATVMLTRQLPVPLQAPLQPVKVEPVPGVAVRVTVLPAAMVALQVLPQFTPAGDEVTVPAPVPALVTLSVEVVGVLRAKVAVRRLAASTTNMQGLFVQAPLQPVKVEPVAGTGVSVTVVPEAMFALQVLPQLMPAGDEVTVPAPVPALPTLSV